MWLNPYLEFPVSTTSPPSLVARAGRMTFSWHITQRPACDDATLQQAGHFPTPSRRMMTDPCPKRQPSKCD